MVGEGLHVLVQAPPVVHDVQGGVPFQAGVDAGLFPAGVVEGDTDAVGVVA